MKYAKVKRNMILLLLVGEALAVAFFWGFAQLYPYSSVMYSLLGMLLLFAFIFYPVALVYGRDQISDLFYGIVRGARQPFPVKPKSAWNWLFKVLNFVIACVTTVSLGWVYGAYTSWQRLQFFKRFANMSERKERTR